MRLTATARLAVNEDGTVTIVVKNFAVSLDKRERLSLWKSCGNPVEKLWKTSEPGCNPDADPLSNRNARVSPEIPVHPVHPVHNGPVDHGQLDQDQEPAVPAGTLDEQAEWIIVRTLEQAEQRSAGAMSHDDLRDGVYTLAVRHFSSNTDVLNAILQRVWNAPFWKQTRGVVVTPTTVWKQKP